MDDARSGDVVEDVRVRQMAAGLNDAARELDLHEDDPSMPLALRLTDRLGEAIGVALMVVVTLLIFFNAFGRYAFGNPIVWADELVIALIPWLAMSGLYLSIRRGTVIRIEYFVDKLPETLRAPVAVFASILSAAAFVALGFYSVQYVALFGGDATTYLRLPRGWFTSALMIGAGAVVIVFACHAVGLVRSMRVPVAGDR